MSLAARRPIDMDADAALIALRRARRRAERVAVATGTCLVQTVQGKLVRVPPPSDATSRGRKRPTLGGPTALPFPIGPRQIIFG